MSEEVTRDMNGTRSFEERVFARFDAMDVRFSSIDVRLDTIDGRLNAIDVRLDGVDSRLQKLEQKSYDTKPIWEQALKEIIDTRRELVEAPRPDRIYYTR